MSDPLSSQRPPARRRGRAIAGILAVALAGGLVGAFASQSFSQGFGPPWHMTVRGPYGGPFGGPLTPQQMADRADRMVRHLAIEIDASADQQAKLETIVKGAVADIAPMRDKMLAARQQMHDLLTQTTIDRAAIEKLRADQMATLDGLSKRIAQAVGDAAEALTPDQRHKLGEMLPPAGGPARGFWHPWYRG
jgi:Spy/CpxP family protein refolding chaperone